MDIVLEDLTLKAKRKMLKDVMAFIKDRVDGFEDDPDYEEENTDFVLQGLINMLDEGDGYDFWGTEGWRENSGI